jgi:hypothetical protein
MREIWEVREAHCRSLHCATPDFLLDLVALTHFMRPSLRKGAYAASSSVAWQEIRVRSGRDDKVRGKLVSIKFTIGIESFSFVLPIRPMQMEAMLSSLSSRPERSVVEGSAVRPSDFPNAGVLTQTLQGCVFPTMHRASSAVSFGKLAGESS